MTMIIMIKIIMIIIVVININHADGHLDDAGGRRDTATHQQVDPAPPAPPK